MTLRLTADTLRAAYEYLITTPPFDDWNLPEGDDVVFKVVRSPRYFGRYMRDHRSRHLIEVSSRLVGWTQTLLKTVAHEMIHLHQGHAGMESDAQHNAAFWALADEVCRIHGFDPKEF